MELISDDIFFEACRSIGFIPATYNSPDFKILHDQDPNYWRDLSTGLLLTVFCHLVEVKCGGKETFKAKLSSSENKDILDVLFYARNSFIHCQWDISKLTFPNQESKIRELVSNGKNKHSSVPFEFTLTGDILDIGSIEPMCRVLLREAGV